MLREILLGTTLIVALAGSAQAADDPGALLPRFMQAWSASDAKGIAALFAPDADLVTPDGIKASGRTAIEAFYTAVFARGYAGSQGVGEVISTRLIAPDLALIDGRWNISGAKTETGAARAIQSGILAAVLRRQSDGWHIVALREGNGASDFHPFPPAP